MATKKSKEIERLPRTRNTPLSENRMHPDDLAAGMRALSNNAVENTSFVVEERGITWKDFGVELGLAPSTLYGMKNGRFNVGTASAVQFARVLGVESWALFLPHEQFLKHYKKSQKE